MIFNGDNKTISFAGLSKNAGKTVAMLYALDEVSGLTPGLLSIGRDGEEKDIVFETKKPTIFVKEGTLIVSTEGLWDFGTAVKSIEEHTSFFTPMGDVLIGKIIRAGTVEIAGPQAINEIIIIRDKLFSYGADVVLVDGALDRTSLAMPDLSDSIVLSAGAAHSSDMDVVIRETVFMVKLLQLPIIDTYREEIDVVMKEGTFGIIENGKLQVFNLPTTLGQDKFLRETLTKDTEMVIFSGAVVEKNLTAIAQSISDKIKVVAYDGTKFFMNEKSFNKFIIQGLNFYSYKSLDLRCVTINPFSPQGYFFPPQEFLMKMSKALPNITILNAMTGESNVCRQ